MAEPSGERYALAADIGGTQMRAAAVTPAGDLVARAAGPTHPERGLEDAAGRLLELLARVRREAGEGAAGLGVSTAGPLDPSSGTYFHPPNLTGWHGQSMKAPLEAALGLPVNIGHDATLAALAETRYGAGIGVRDLIYVTVSTGIGGGIVANGAVVTGSQGGAGEVGHMIVQPGGPRCGIGCPGCLEAMASGPSIARAAREAIESGRSSSLGAVESVEAPAVFEAAAAGDALAREVIASAIRALGAGLAGLLAALDPAVIVLGGGVMRGVDAHWDELIAAVRDQALPRYAERVPLARTTLGGDVSLLGAAVMAFDAAGIAAGKSDDRQDRGQALRL